MKKTIEQWLKENLTEEQYKESSGKPSNNKDGWEKEVEFLSEAIEYGFYWSSMIEGFDYWCNKYKKLVDQSW